MNPSGSQLPETNGLFNTLVSFNVVKGVGVTVRLIHPRLGFPPPGGLRSPCSDAQRVLLANVVERLKNGFFTLSQLFHPMFKINNYIAVDSRVQSERHMCHIFSLLGFFS